MAGMPDEIRRPCLEALRRVLGPVGTVASLQQFETGSGDSKLARKLSDVA